MGIRVCRSGIGYSVEDYGDGWRCWKVSISLPSLVLRLFYVPLTFLNSSVRFWDFAVPISCSFCCLTALARSLSLGTAFPLHVVAACQNLHCYCYIYIYSPIDAPCTSCETAQEGWSTFCVRVLVVFSCLHMTRIKLAGQSLRLPTRVIFLLLLVLVLTASLTHLLIIR